MDRLTDRELSDVLARCAENPNYQAGVLFTHRGRHEDFMQAMKDVSSENPWSVNMRKCTISFRNGSAITALPISKDACRGRLYNEILFDGDIDEDILKYVYDPLLVPYIQTQTLGDDEPDESLTNFLDEFKVTE